MATGDRVQIADKPTLDAVRTNIGNTNDTGGTSTTGTTQAKLNAALVKTDGVSQDIRELNNRLSGVNSPYGNGIYGDTVYSPTTFVWPSQDSFNRYVLQFDSLIIPAGVTMRPPEKCDGLYILCKGNITINGNIDVTGLRKTFTESTKISSTINVGTKTYALAKGGYGPKGGASGAGGDAKETASSTDSGSPAVTPTKSIAGNVNGGGVGYFGGGVPSAGADSDSNSDWYTVDMSNNVLPELYLDIAPTALVIIAAGVVSISGNINAQAYPGVAAQGGMIRGLHGGSSHSYLQTGSQAYRDPATNKRVYIPMAPPTSNPNEALTLLFNAYKRAGITQEETGGAGVRLLYVSTISGSGAIPPTGGGAVTIICKTLSNTGVIDTSGAKLVSPNGTDDNTLYYASNQHSYPRIYGSKGGKGGTFVSTPGEIKIYETGGNS